MNILTSTKPDSSRTATVDAETTLFSLHIVQPGHPDRAMPLATGKCTVGSSSRCQIQLASSQVRPLHCLINYEATGVVVTRWATGAYLNEQEFTSSSFQPGDCLRIGDVEVTLVADSAVEKQTPIAQPQKPAPVETAIVQPPVLPQSPIVPQRMANSIKSTVSSRRVSRPAMSAAYALESDRLVRQLWSANFGARQRCRNLVHTLRDERTEAGNLDQQLGILQEQLRRTLVERERISDELNQFQFESTSREEQVAAEMDRLITELNLAYEKSSEAETASTEYLQNWTELRQQLETLHTEREQLDQSREAGELLCNNLVQTLEAHEQSIFALQSELAEAREATSRAEDLRAQQTTHCESIEEKLQHLQDEREQLVVDRTESLERHQAAEQLLVERNRQLEQLQASLEQSQATTETVASRDAENAATNEKLRAEFEELQLQKNELEENIAKFQRYQPEWESAVAERDQRIGELLREMEQVHGTILELEERNAKQSANSQDLQAALQQAKEEHAQLLESQAHTQECQTKWEQSLSERDSRIEQLQGQLQQTHQETESTKHSHLEQTAHIERLQAELQKVQDEQSQFAANGEQRQQRVTELEQGLSERDSQLDHLQGELERAQAAAASAEKNLHEQADNRDRLQADLEERQQEHERIIASHAEREQEWEQTQAGRDRHQEELYTELESLRTSAQAAEQKVAEHVVAISKIQEDLSTLQQERDLLKGSLAEHSAGQEQWEQSLADRDRRIEEMEAEYKSICEALEAFEQGAFEQIDACKRLEEQLAEVCEERDQLVAGQPEHERQKFELEETLQSRDQQVAELSEELGSLGENRSQLQSELEKKKSTAEELESQVSVLRDRCEELSDQSQSSQQHQVELQQTLTEKQSEFEQLHHQLENAEHQKEEFETTLAERTAHCESLESGQTELQARCEELVDKLATNSDRCQELESDIAQRQQHIDLFEADLKSVRAELRSSVEQTQQLEEKRSNAETQLASLREELGAKDAHLVDLNGAESASRQECEELVRTLEAAREELKLLREQSAALNADADSTAALPEAWEEEKTSLVSQIEERSRAADQISSELEGVRSELSAQRTQADEADELYRQSQRELSEARECLLVAEKALLGQAANQEAYQLSEPTGETEASYEEEMPSDANRASDEEKEAAIARLKEMAVWSENENASDQPEESEAQQEFTPTSFIDSYNEDFSEEDQLDEEPTRRVVAENNAPEISGLEDESDDAALEAYMQNMMQRVRGDSGSKNASTPQPKPGKTPAEEPVASVETVEEAASEQVATDFNFEDEQKVADEEPFSLESMKRSARKPAMETDLAAMRELANSSARKAIATHNKGRYVEAAFSKLVICLIATGLAAYMFMTTQDYLSASSIGGWVAATIGVIWGFGTVKVLLEAVRAGSHRQEIPAEIATNDQPLPIDIDPANDVPASGSNED